MHPPFLGQLPGVRGLHVLPNQSSPASAPTTSRRRRHLLVLLLAPTKRLSLQCCPYTFHNPPVCTPRRISTATHALRVPFRTMAGAAPAGPPVPRQPATVKTCRAATRPSSLYRCTDTTQYPSALSHCAGGFRGEAGQAGPLVSHLTPCLLAPEGPRTPPACWPWREARPCQDGAGGPALRALPLSSRVQSGSSFSFFLPGGWQARFPHAVLRLRSPAPPAPLPFHPLFFLSCRLAHPFVPPCLLPTQWACFGVE
jgi:hypothetical protein